MGSAPEIESRKTTPLWRKVLPFLLAVGLVTWVASQIDFDQFVHALAGTNYLAYLAFGIVFTLALLSADSFATAYVYRRTIGPIKVRELFTVRGASYLPSMLNHHVGQAWLTYFMSKVYRASVWRMSGATLVVYATTFGCLFLFGSLGAVLSLDEFPWLLPVMGGVGVLGIGYAIVVRIRPSFLARRETLRAIFDLGIRGQLTALAFRLPHMIVLFIGSWVPFLFFDVDIPLSAALALVPPLMLVAALPLTPQGVGTRDALGQAVFAGFAVGTADEQAAAVAAATLSWAVVVTVSQLPISLILLRPAYRLMARGVDPAAQPEEQPEPS